MGNLQEVHLNMPKIKGGPSVWQEMDMGRTLLRFEIEWAQVRGQADKVFYHHDLSISKMKSLWNLKNYKPNLGQHPVFRHEDGVTCIQDENGVWYTPYDAGGEGPNCERPHKRKTKLPPHAFDKMYHED